MKLIFRCLVFGMLIFLSISCSVVSKLDKQSTNTFSKDQIALIMKDSEQIPMRVFKTTDHSDSLLLRQISEDVVIAPNDKVLQTLIARMHSTVLDSASMGVGIAAPQVGILKNIIWVQRFDKEDQPFEVYLNPRITQYSVKKQECREGCLSIPERTDTLNARSYAILLEYDKLDKTHVVEMVEGFTAVIFQHEIDHLNGVLYVDYVAGSTSE